MLIPLEVLLTKDVLILLFIHNMVKKKKEKERERKRKGNECEKISFKTKQIQNKINRKEMNLKK